MSDTFVIQDMDPVTGIVTRVHRTENRVAIEKEFDAAPLVEMAAAARTQTAGERWGEMRHVGFIPIAELGKFMRQDGGFDRARVMAYLKANPALVTFDKALK